MKFWEKIKRRFRIREEHEKLIIVDGKYILFEKFTLFQRLLHVAAFTTFIWQVLTGFPLKYAYTDWAKIVYSLFGGPKGAMTIHRIMGVLMVLTYIVTVVYFILILVANADKLKRFFEHFKAVPGPSDRTFIHYLKYLLGLRKVPPDWDEWIWVDKFDLWAEAWGIFAMGITGLILWMPEVFTGLLPLPSETIQIAYIVHVYEAMLALGWIALVHMYVVHYSPHKFPMDWIWLSGTASEVEWLEERPKSYRRIIKAVAEREPHLLEKYPFLKERYQFVLEVEKLPEEEMIKKMREFAHKLLEEGVERG
jgi:cytochrome b subunit of formate dehydrogenase